MAVSIPDDLDPSQLLDLTFLTPEERKKISQVLDEDDKLLTEERIRLGSVRQNIERKRYHQKQFDNKRQCSICERPLGQLFNSGALCPSCGHRVCKHCYRPLENHSSKFLCNNCFEMGVLQFQSQDYMSSNHHVYYGTSLVRMSIQCSATCSVSPTPIKFSDHVSSRSTSPVPAAKYDQTTLTPPPDSTSNYPEESISQDNSTGSSLVVRYSEASFQSRGSPAPARQLTASELSDSEEEGESGNLPGLSSHYGLNHKESISSSVSSLSLYSSAGGTKGDYDISGEVLIGVELQQDTLVITVNRARGLAAADKNGLSDPYIKTYLLPDKSKKSKRKTKVKKKTLDPVYQETLKYKLLSSDVVSCTLWLSVWDHDRFGRNDFLGEVHIPLSSLDLSDSTQHWYTLQDRHPDELHGLMRGNVIIGLQYVPSHSTGGDLHVRIKCAKKLNFQSTTAPDAFAICYLLPNRTKSKTMVVNNSHDPIWEEEFVFSSVSLENLTKERVLEVTIWDYNHGSSNDFLGGVRLGPLPSQSSRKKDWMDCSGEEVTHWKAMLAHAGQWVESQHMLRPDMDPRDIDHMELDESTICFPPPITEVTEEEPIDTIVQSIAPKDHTHELAKGLSLGFATSLKVVDDEDDPVIKDYNEMAHPQNIFHSDKESNTHTRGITESKGLESSAIASSFGSMLSINDAVEKGDYDISGEVLFGIILQQDILTITVNRAKGLAAADKNGLSDPYIKTYLLPDKHSKKKTSIKKKTLDPVYQETIKYKLLSSEISSRTLWLSVWDHDRFGRNQFLGEMYLALSSVDLSDSTQHWHTLQDRFSHKKEISCNEVELSEEPVFQKAVVSTKPTTLTTHDDAPPTIPPLKPTEGVLPQSPLTQSVRWKPSSTSHTQQSQTAPNTPVINNEDTTRPRNSSSPHTLSQHHDDEHGVTVHDTPVISLGQGEPQLLSKSISSSSLGSTFSINSAAEIHKGDYSISGEVLFGVELQQDTLAITVNRARGLAAADKNGLSDPYVKTYLLPDKHSKRKTTTKQKTLNPVYQETIKYKLSSSDISSRTLWLSLWDHDRLGRNQFLGEVHLPLSSLDLSDSTQHWHILHDRGEGQGHQAAEMTLESVPKLPLTQVLKPTDSMTSFGSTFSVYSNIEDNKGEYDISGEVLLGIELQQETLLLTINRAKGLAATDKHGLSNPYIKTYLLPDKSPKSKRKTAVKRKTLEPVYKETLKYKLSSSEISSRTLWLSVWDYDRFGRNQFLGEIHLPLSSLDLSDSTQHWYTLQDRHQLNEDTFATTATPEIELGLQLQQTYSSTSLKVLVKKAKNLKCTKGKTTIDPYIKCYLLPDRSSSSKRKTRVIQGATNPTWDEELVYYNVNPDELSKQRVLEVTVWDAKGRSHEQIGGFRLGPSPHTLAKCPEWMDSIGKEISHWENVIDHPNEWITLWHSLRESMEPRDILF